MSHETCSRCGKALERSFHAIFVQMSAMQEPDDKGWHWINPAPDATGTAAVVAVCNKCDPPPVLVPRATYDALVAAAEALITNFDDRLYISKELTALRAVGIVKKEGSAD